MTSRKPTNKRKYETLETVRKVAVRNAVGIKFINGVSNKYEEEFPNTLKGLVD